MIFNFRTFQPSNLTTKKERCLSGRKSTPGPKDSFGESVYTSQRSPSDKRVSRFEVFFNMYYSYILKSLKDGRYYYGSTNDVEKRLIKHNSGQVKATKGRRPFEIHFTEEHVNRSLAFQREMFYKSIEGYNYLKQNNII